jgi:glycosyltransferase involved in cell wall biosynthesis
MVWAGTDHRRQFARYQRMWGDRGDRVTWCGPLGKPQLYALVRRAVATVAPSRCDNIPNTVLESLQLGTPVIGSDGASIDEIVEAGIQGELVPVGDVEALARMLVRAWNGAPPFDGRQFPRPPIFKEMSQVVAVRNLLEMAGRNAAPAYREVA